MKAADGSQKAAPTRWSLGSRASRPVNDAPPARHERGFVATAGLDASDERAGVRYDVGFPVQGGPLPFDHGYALFGALCHALGDLHGAPWLQVLPLAASRSGADSLRPGNHPATLRLRVTPERIGTVVALAGQTLEVAGTRLLVGVPSVYPLRPSRALVSRLVTFKNHLEEATFVERAASELARKTAYAEFKVGRRLVVHVAGSKVVGFGLAVRGLSDSDSLRLQYEGLGGRQRFGCGVFGPPTDERLSSFGQRFGAGRPGSNEPEVSRQPSYAARP
jgi:CRISPR-associated protein Cas6